MIDLSTTHGGSPSAHSDAKSRVSRAWFVHGMLETESSWLPLIKSLDPETAETPEFPWSAQSNEDWTEGCESRNLVRAFIDKQKQVADVLIGHSYGCNALLELLGEAGIHQPKALVLFCPFYAEDRSKFTWDYFTTLADGLEELIRDSLKSQDHRGRYNGWLLESMTGKIKDRLGFLGWFEFVKMYVRSSSLNLDAITCPTLIISGNADKYSEVATHALLASRMPNATHLVFDGGHFVHMTHADEAALAITNFLKRLNGK